MDTQRDAIDTSLLKLDLFRSLTEPELNAVCGLFATLSLGEGEVLYREGERIDKIYILCSGAAIYQRCVGQSKQVSIGRSSQAVDTVGESFFYEEAVVTSATVTARTNCTLYVAPRAKLLRFLEDHPGIERKVTRTLVDKLSRQLEHSDANVVAVSTKIRILVHEMNTPLGVVKSATRMVQSLTQEFIANAEDPTGLEEILGDIRTSTDLMGKNTEKLGILLTRFREVADERLDGDYANYRLGEILQEAIDEFDAEFGKKGIRVRTWLQEEDLCWFGDGFRLSQVLRNLLQNIGRYAYPEAGGDVDIRLFASEPGQRSYILEIQDYGTGIAPEVLPNIFEPFVTTGSGRGGTGLGLAICFDIVKNVFGGEVSCESEVGQGTKFKLTIPRNLDHQIARKQTP